MVMHSKEGLRLMLVVFLFEITLHVNFVLGRKSL